MPVTKSAIKEMRKNAKRRLMNKSVVSAMKTAIKRIRKSKTKEEALKLYRDTVIRIDKANSKGIIHKNTANRLKSRVSKFINKLT